MNQFFRILLRYRIFITFLALEMLCAALIVENNRYQSAAFFTNAHHFFARIYSINSSITQFVDLGNENEALQKENAYLKTLVNSIQIDDPNSGVLVSHEFIAARVVDNSVMQANNYIIIDKGTDDDIRPGMGVVSGRSVVGKVKSCSRHFSTVYSLLNSAFSVSAKIKGTETNSGLCTAKWLDPSNPTKAQIIDVSQHTILKEKDTITTSGYSGVFPGNYLIGVVEKISIDEANGKKDIAIRLTTNFSNLSSVYIVKSPNRDELDSLKTKINETNK